MQSPVGTKKRRASSPPAAEVTAKKMKISDDADEAAQSGYASEKEEIVATKQNKPVEAVVSKEEGGDVALMGGFGKDLGKVKEVADGESGPKQPKNPPIKSCFEPWKPTVTIPPKNPFWGIKPKTGDTRPHPDQPSARESNGATNPPMWEDRKFRFVRGQRHVKYFGPIEPPNAESLPDLDQEDLLVIQLIDMRDGGKKNPGPRRQPTFYAYEHGKPKDWANGQAVKALNDRRQQAIDRHTLDDPWSAVEKTYLASLLAEYPDASIWELTERHNDRFMGVDFVGATAFEFSDFSTGRTVESVRHEYVTFKAFYDNGEAPTGVRWRTEKSKQGRALHAAKKMEELFGLPDKKLEKAFDDQKEVGDGDEEAVDGTHSKATRASKKSKKTVQDTEDEGELENVPNVPHSAQPKLNELDEELLKLAGAYEPNWSPVAPEEEDRLARDVVEQTVKEVVDELVDTTVDHAGSVGLGIDFGVDSDVEAAYQTAIVEQIETHPRDSTEATVDTTRKQIKVEVQDETAVQADTAVQETTIAATSILEEVVPLHAARHVSLDENYDDDDDEGFESA
ncbi:hypothetical protein BKA63DRAFT_460855 [Paraphoma chrysanthemicola]|nr:hypothetical protein BKA63DRAFT_460855 [Paraphoma chrysanthemicola]